MNIYLNAQRLEAKLLAEKAKNAKLEANLEYLSMMSDIPIPTDEEEEDGPLKEI